MGSSEINCFVLLSLLGKVHIQFNPPCSVRCLGLTFCSIIIEPRHEISNNVVCVTSKGSDQPAHVRSLIRAFASRLNILRLLGY